jgi:hypothetical protein
MIRHHSRKACLDFLQILKAQGAAIDTHESLEEISPRLCSCVVMDVQLLESSDAEVDINSQP